MLSHKYVYTQSDTHKHPADMYKLPHRCRTPPLPLPPTRARTTGTRVLFYKAAEGLGVERGPFPQTLDCATQGEEVAPSLITVGQRRSRARVLRQGLESGEAGPAPSSETAQPGKWAAPLENQTPPRAPRPGVLGESSQAARSRWPPH